MSRKQVKKRGECSFGTSNGINKNSQCITQHSDCRMQEQKQLKFTGLEAEAEELDISSFNQPVFFEHLLGARPCSGV